MKRDINKIQVENVHVEIYHTWLNIYVGDTVYDCLFHADLLKNPDKETWLNIHAVFWVCSKRNSWFIAFSKDKINPGTIAHECFHATCRILKQKGMVYSEDSEEAYAYLLDYLVTKVTELVVKNKPPEKLITTHTCDHEFIADGGITGYSEQHAVCNKCGYKP